jgi:hypothetical protein
MEIANYEQRQQQPVDTSENEDDMALLAFVKKELESWRHAKGKWEDELKRMRENTEFVYGLQAEDQKKMKDPAGRYQANWMLRAIKNKEAQLYAKNPKVEVKLRPGLDFEIWDGSVEMLQESMVGVQVSNHVGMPNMQAFATMQDFMSGRAFQKLIERVSRTIELVLGYQFDTANPEFLAQMKKLVCRVLTCGVGYILPSLVLPSAPSVPSSTEVKSDIQARVKKVRAILEKLQDEKIDVDSPEVLQLKNLIESLEVSQETNDYQLGERIEFDFPSPDVIIPDENCRDLVNFVGCKRVFYEFDMSVDDVNEFFELSGEQMVQVSGGTVIRGKEAEQIRELGLSDGPSSPTEKAMCTVIRVFNVETKSDYYLVEGHKTFVREPAPLEPCVLGVLPIVTIAFNNIECIPNTKATPFPPSDVDLMKDAQKEWNRTRDALRGQRNANAPTYVTRKNALSQDDKDNLRNREPNEVIELEQVPPDKTPAEMIQVLQVAQIDPAVYDTAPQEQDMQLCGGSQQADIGPAQPDVTATAGTIAEQARISNLSSNVQDLDWGLSRLAFMCVQMIVQGFGEDTVKKIARRGAIWPTEYETRADILNQVDVTVKAASSGRPNQALQVSMIERLTPLLMQAGANPIALITELCKAMDPDLDPQKFFPVPGQAMQTSAPQGQGQPGARPNPPGRVTPSPGPGGPPPQQQIPMVSPQQPIQRGMAPEATPVSPIVN